jgi:hypothetical protein
VPELELDEWISVLKLATVWGLPAARKVAIEMLADYAQHDPIARLSACIKYSILSWLVPAVNKLAQRESYISFADVERLETLGASEALRLALKIQWVRETFVGQKARIPTPHFGPSSSKVKVTYSITQRCGVTLECGSHNLQTLCLGDGYVGGTHQDRAAHDFTDAICQIFECYEDRRPWPQVSRA